MTAQEWNKPALTLTAVVDGLAPSRPDTYTGDELLKVVPFPSWPTEFDPQQVTAPLAIKAHEWNPPAANDTAVNAGVDPSSAVTSTGEALFVVLASPN